MLLKKSFVVYQDGHPFVLSVFTVSALVMGSLIPQVPLPSQERCEIQLFCIVEPMDTV